MESALLQARKAFEAWKTANNVRQVVIPMVKNVIPQPIQPKEIEKPKIKPVVKKKKKTIKRNDGKPQHFGPSKKQMENTQVLWASMPPRELPIVRMATNLFNLDPDYITTSRIEAVKAVVEMAVKAVGSESESKIIEWIRKQKAFYKISGERQAEQLRMMLRMN